MPPAKKEVEDVATPTQATVQGWIRIVWMIGTGVAVMVVALAAVPWLKASIDDHEGRIRVLEKTVTQQTTILGRVDANVAKLIDARHP